MPQSRIEFTIVGRGHFSQNLRDLAKLHSSARSSVEYLRSEVRGVLLAVAAGDGYSSLNSRCQFSRVSQVSSFTCCRVHDSKQDEGLENTIIRCVSRLIRYRERP